MKGLTVTIDVHADYPHDAGTLFDCPACESTCYCGHAGTCVYCCLVAEAAHGPGGSHYE